MVLNYTKVNYWSYLLGYRCGPVLEDNRQMGHDKTKDTGFSYSELD